MAGGAEGGVDEIFPVEHADVRSAKDLALGALGLSSRDALHVAVMRRQGIERILTFDRDFDRVPGIDRVEL